MGVCRKSVLLLVTKSVVCLTCSRSYGFKFSKKVTELGEPRDGAWFPSQNEIPLQTTVDTIWWGYIDEVKCRDKS